MAMTGCGLTYGGIGGSVGCDSALGAMTAPKSRHLRVKGRSRWKVLTDRR